MLPPLPLLWICCWKFNATRQLLLCILRSALPVSHATGAPADLARFEWWWDEHSCLKSDGEPSFIQCKISFSDHLHKNHAKYALMKRFFKRFGLAVWHRWMQSNHHQPFSKHCTHHNVSGRDHTTGVLGCLIPFCPFRQSEEKSGLGAWSVPKFGSDYMVMWAGVKIHS